LNVYSSIFMPFLLNVYFSLLRPAPCQPCGSSMCRASYPSSS
jgi:hypothetical protein